MGQLEGTETGVLGRRVEEDQRVARFVSKLLGEALHLEADSIHFLLEGEALTGSVRRAKTELKSVILKAGWFKPLCAWLLGRVDRVFGRDTRSGEVIEDARGDWSTQVSARVGQEIVSFAARREAGLTGRISLVLTGFSVVPFEKAVEVLGSSERAQVSAEELLGAERGLILLSAPDDATLAQALSTILSLSNAVPLGSLGDPEVRAEGAAIGANLLGVVTVRSGDLLDGWLKTRELQWTRDRYPFVGALCMSFVRRVCSSCARQTPVAPQFMERIPEVLRPHDLSSYLVGRGCELCGHTGYDGWTGLSSAVRFTPELLNPFFERADETALAALLYARGTRSLMESGIRLALEGRTTFESIFESIKTVPQVFLELARQKVHAKPVEERSLEISDDFFTGGPSPKERPLVGKAAFVGRTPAADDEPIIAPDVLEKRRTKPLVLVVEDDVDQRSILELTLKTAHYDVLLAGDGQQALDVLETQIPDLVLTDLMMPNMDGRQLVHRLRNTGRLQQIPIVVLTVITDTEREFDLLSIGADDYCDKTVQRKILLKRIENLLKRTKRG